MAKTTKGNLERFPKPTIDEAELLRAYLFNEEWAQGATKQDLSRIISKTLKWALSELTGKDEVVW